MTTFNLINRCIGSNCVNLIALIFTLSSFQISFAQVSESELESISTPDSVETSIGELEFFDGVPTDNTVKKVYDNLDLMRGVEAFLNTLPGASIYRMREGYRSIGADKANKIVIYEDLVDSNSLYLTANTSTVYVFNFLDLKNDGPTVVEIAPGALGAFNDMWFRYVADVGVAGADKGEGGKYLVLPPDFKGDVPEGYFVVKPKTYGVWLFQRGSLKDGDPKPAVDNFKQNMRVYPLSKADDPPKTEFINASGKQYNTISPNDFSFYEDINQLIQEEPIDSLDPETRGILSAIGIIKGKPFNPDDRMKKILTDAVAIANATSRAIVFQPRDPGAYIYKDSNSSWVMAYSDKDVFFLRDGARNLDARTMFFYPYTGVTPAMAVSHPGVGSDYGIAYLDSAKQPLDGSKVYKLRLPPNIPVKNFWAVTIYDTQTRSMLKTGQKFPTLSAQTGNPAANEDGSIDIYFAPKPPVGKENNWLETVPGKSWFAILRMYGPLEPWIKQTWRPSEIELVNKD